MAGKRKDDGSATLVATESPSLDPATLEVVFQATQGPPTRGEHPRALSDPRGCQARTKSAPADDG